MAKAQTDEKNPNKVFVISVVEKFKHAANFEEAVSATGFGHYNFLLILIAIPAGWASIFEITSMSYVFPAAQCDLDLSLNDKGLLNAATYCGMISSALAWGFLYDAFGRRKLIMVGFLLDAIFVLISSFSQTKIMLLMFKFLGGFVINGPFVAFTSYLSEFHSSKYRPRMQMILGTIYSSGSIIMPMLAWAVFPQNFDILKFNPIELNSWNLFLFFCAFPSIISAIAFVFLPESPKFLMTSGKNEEALKVFRTIYSYNTGNAPKTFPIEKLVDETQENENFHQRGGWNQVKPLFSSPYLISITLVCLMQTVFTVGLSTLRLWLPQIFQAINDYKYYHNETTADLCTMLKMMHPTNVTEDCYVNVNNSETYVNSIIVSVVCMISYFFAGFLIGTLGKRRLITVLGVTCGITACLIYLANNTLTAVFLSAIYIAAVSIANNVVTTVAIDLFPTSLRTMTLALSMMLARMGAIGGNMLFPFLLGLGCAPPFFSIGVLLIVCSFIALLLPNTDSKSLV